MYVVIMSGLNVKTCKLKKELGMEGWRHEWKAGTMHEGASGREPLC
jgi:hypothetical protein